MLWFENDRELGATVGSSTQYGWETSPKTKDVEIFGKKHRNMWLDTQYICRLRTYIYNLKNKGIVPPSQRPILEMCELFYLAFDELFMCQISVDILPMTK